MPLLSRLAVGHSINVSAWKERIQGGDVAETLSSIESELDHAAPFVVRYRQYRFQLIERESPAFGATSLVSYGVDELCRIFQQVSASLRGSEDGLHQLEIEIDGSRRHRLQQFVAKPGDRR